MREIRFRAKGVDGGIFHGDLIHSNGLVYIRDPYKLETREVKPDSVVQLVGYDADGCEVYEGDALKTDDGLTIYAAVLYHAKVAPAKDCTFTQMAKDNHWRLDN